ncbi:uncharacterized protein HD556DRAFT_1439784 [Suillus plorans]|uniref:DDE Tnp4 domain-containing protein n=1 Tax=Suillus plorans TaxID=116603 RepID=A0A9P7DNV7_9AGAM|nr:uncharacterized protein HD556DRAFT_1439784 [Suillus plorans]KAG1799403.1 hypothetical protein HD556DRAFT_1439784 [Suillus plorans]
MDRRPSDDLEEHTELLEGQKSVEECNSNNPQLSVSNQLAIFLNHAGHYDNAISLEDVAQWEHDQFIFFPEDDSKDAELAWWFAETRTCLEWRGGYLVIDGSTMDLFIKPAYFDKTFYDRKSKQQFNLILDNYYAPYVFQFTCLYEEHVNLLPDDYWVWADSAYPLEPWCIPLLRSLTMDN